MTTQRRRDRDPEARLWWERGADWVPARFAVRDPESPLTAALSVVAVWLTWACAAVLLAAVMVTACGSTGCAALKPALRTINDAASILCSTAFGVADQAKAEGLSVEDWCAVQKNLKPFLDEALKARAAGARAAGLASPTPGQGH